MTEIEVAKRLEKLERDNRRFKRLAIAGVVIAVTLGLMAATRPLPDVIKAHRFEAVDQSGRERVRISATNPSGSPRIMLYDKAHVSDVAILGFETGGASISLGPERRLKAFGGEFRDDVLINDLIPGDPNIELSDRQGHEMDLGGTITRTIATRAIQRTSADSIVMFGNDKEHRVIWKAP